MNLKRNNFTTEQIAEAFSQAGGILAGTAKILGISRNTLNSWLEADPELQQAKKDADAVNVDVAERVLMSLVRKEFFPAVKYYLSIKGRDRGYSNNVDITTNGNDISFRMGGEAN